jgi:AcrR family transcriptional regulator
MYVHSKIGVGVPRRAEQNEALRDASRARIIAHALALFAAQGYEQTTVKQIAQSAGMAQGLLYNYFAGKEALLRAIFEQSMVDVGESFVAAAEAAPGTRVEALLRSSFTIIRRNLAFWQLGYSVRTQPGVLASLGPAMAEWTSSILRTLEETLRAEGTPDAATQAAVLFALIDGIAQHYALDPEHYPLDLVAEAAIGLYHTKF